MDLETFSEISLCSSEKKEWNSLPNMDLETFSEVCLCSPKKKAWNSLPNIHFYLPQPKQNPPEITVIRDRLFSSDFDGGLLIPDTGSDQEPSHTSLGIARIEESQKTLPPVEPRYYKLIFLREATEKEYQISEPTQRRSWVKSLRKSLQDVTRYFPCIRICVDI